MNVPFIITVVALIGTNAFSLYLLARASKRLLQFDDLFQLLSHDMDVNIRYLTNLLKTPVFSNSPEVEQANKNMGIINQRLHEYTVRFEELTSTIRAQEEEIDRQGV